MPVRKLPSRDADIAGARATGEEVIADVVRTDGWVKLSHADTYAGWQAYSREADEMWMLRCADDVGELLREVVIDENGREVDDDMWLPEMS